MIFSHKPKWYKGLWVFNPENLTPIFSVIGVTLPSGSEVSGSCYLGLIVGEISIMNGNLAQFQPDKNFTI